MTGSIPPARFVIVVGIDESPSADLVLERAVALARQTPGSEIHLVHAADLIRTDGATPVVMDALERHRDLLDRRAREAQTTSGVNVVAHFHATDAARAILQTAASVDADMIVVGTTGKRGLERLILGSVAQVVVQRASCTVLVVRSKDHVASHAPEIEPPCPDCLATQRASGGEKLWCARHSQHHPHPHAYFEAVGSFGAGSNLIRPNENG